MDSFPSNQNPAQELADALMRHELQVLEEVRALLEAHRGRRLEVRRELRSLMSQFGQFPERNNVHHLRLVKTDSNGSAEASA